MAVSFRVTGPLVRRRGRRLFATIPATVADVRAVVHLKGTAVDFVKTCGYGTLLQARDPRADDLGVHT